MSTLSAVREEAKEGEEQGKISSNRLIKFMFAITAMVMGVIGVLGVIGVFGSGEIESNSIVNLLYPFVIGALGTGAISVIKDVTKK